MALAPAFAGADAIPYVAGLKIVTSAHEEDGDYESVKTIGNPRRSSPLCDAAIELPELALDGLG